MHPAARSGRLASGADGCPARRGGEVAVEGIQEPVDRRLQAVLRRAVLDHVASERRRSFTPLLHVGCPGGPQTVFAPADEPADQGLRTDVVAALLRRTARTGPAAVPGPLAAPLVWLTRPGDLVLQDLDVAWLAACRAAGAEAGRSLALVVVTRRGWRDPRSGVGRTWQRLRPR